MENSTLSKHWWPIFANVPPLAWGAGSTHLTWKPVETKQKQGIILLGTPESWTWIWLRSCIQWLPFSYIHQHLGPRTSSGMSRRCPQTKTMSSGSNLLSCGQNHGTWISSWRCHQQGSKHPQVTNRLGHFGTNPTDSASSSKLISGLVCQIKCQNWLVRRVQGSGLKHQQNQISYQKTHVHQVF